MNWTLEVIIVPVSDVDRARAFYEKQLGFNVDHDTRVNEAMRIVQLTPPGSGCSIVIGTGIPMTDGAIKGLQLVVNDIRKAHAQLTANGVDVSEIIRMGENRPDFEGDELDFIGFIYFSDPDGNEWTVQQISSRP
ncbi:MAG: VOC family protein [Anaerolineae bacterium]|nr:VOC family protein [Anaerolineae bacterium]